MTAQTFLGIDAGGTHTDAVLCGPEGILAGAKAPTCHEDLPSSVRAALAALEKAEELKLIDGYCIGSLTAQQVLTWFNETKEVMKAVARQL